MHSENIRLVRLDNANRPGVLTGVIAVLSRGRFCDNVLEWADRYRWLLYVTMAGFYAAAFNGQWRIQSDAALYLSIGRNLAHGAGFTYLGEPNRVAYPGWPGLIAITFKMFGSRSLVPVNALMLLIALATIAATYRLFLLHAGRPTAVVVSLGVGLTKAFFTYAFELWTDMPFACGVMCVLAGYEGLSTTQPSPKRLIDTVFFVGGLIIAGSMRPTIWPFLAALILALIFRSIKRKSVGWIITGAIAAAVVVVGACFLFGLIRSGLPSYGSAYGEYLLNRITGKNTVATHTLTENINNLFSWAASDVLFQARLGATCNALLSTVVLALGFSLFRYRILWGFWFCLLLATILVSQETLDRYFLPVLPLLVFAWWDLLVRINRALSLPWANVLFLSMLCCGGTMNITKVCGIIIQQQQRPFLASFDKGVYDGTPEFAKKLNEHVGEKAIILAKAPYGRVTAYLSERYVIGAIGTPASLLKDRHVFVVEPSDMNVQNLLKSAGLIEGPAMFTVSPSPGHGPQALSLSLHPAHLGHP